MRLRKLIGAKLQWLARVSSGAVVVGLINLAAPAAAHEVLPTVGYLSSEDQTLRLELRLNAEALLAGIDLDGLTDTNNSDSSEDYDALRMLEPDVLETRILDNWDQLAQDLKITSDGVDVPMTPLSVDVSEVGDLELPRPTQVILTGPLPDGARTVQLSWPDGFGTLAVRQTGVEDGYAGYLDGGETTEPIQLGGAQAQPWHQVFASYIPVGFDHILPKGLDHILFVLGLFFLSPNLRPLLWQISAFTLAHTVTLALGAFGLVNVPGSIVEPLIAASIAFIAIENILSPRLTKWRPVIVFGFGLLHGLGFASVLQQFGLPQAQFIPALIGFNVGVEFGQLTVIALAYLAVGAWFGQKPWYRARIAIPASVVIACIGLYWAVERTFL